MRERQARSQGAVAVVVFSWYQEIRMTAIRCPQGGGGIWRCSVVGFFWGNLREGPDKPGHANKEENQAGDRGN